MKTQNKKIFFFTILFLLSLISTYSETEKSSAPSRGDSLIAIFNAIWPDGNCAENISGSNKYTQITYACNDNYTAHQRNDFLDALLKYGWKLRKETYRIESNTASYFYKFESRDMTLYIKLFFRNPSVVWPLHDNQRPKMAVFVNNVKSTSDLEKWTDLKLPLSVSISIFENDYDKIIQLANQSGYDLWIFFPGTFDTKIVTAENLERLTLELKKIPEENFPFSGLTIPFSSESLKDTQSLRLLLNSMKKNGLRKILAPPTLEVIDTSKILGVTSLTAVFDLSAVKDDPETVWRDSYAYALKYGYSVIVLDADDYDSMKFLLKMIENNLDYIDYVNLRRLPIPENPLSRQQ